MINRKQILSLVFFLLLGINQIPAKERVHAVHGWVVDNMTGRGIDSVRVILLTVDSIVIDTAYVRSASEGEQGRYRFSVARKGKYIVKAVRPGYNDGYKDFEIRSNREQDVWVDKIRLIKILRLSEVTITSTKIKMVMKGDTIVYNADAFNLAEGSMLDVLISRLPGTRLTREGKIYVNGRYVQSLLINGQDFFTGNPKMALENLPAYTVNKIKVYEKSGDASRIMGRSMGDMSYVMDVRLKKEYAVGYIGNLEAGAGSHGRYKLKAFLMKFSEKEMLLTFGNINNLNDFQTASPTGEWSAKDNPNGLFTNRMASLSYVRFLKYPLDYFSTTNTFSHTDADIQTKQASQTFLDHGDLFRHERRNQNTKSTTINSRNEFTLQPEDRFLRLVLDLKYNSDEGLFRVLTETSDSVSLLNKLITRGSDNTKNISLDFESQMGKKIIADFIRWEGSVKYDRTTGEYFSLYDLTYTNDGIPRDFRNTYRDKSHQHWDLMGSMHYDWGLYDIHIRPECSQEYIYNKTSNLLYRLDKLSDRDSSAFDILPSARDALGQVIDQNNSYNFHEYQNHYRATVQFRGDRSAGDKGRWSWNTDILLHYANKKMFYERNGHHEASRHSLFFEPRFSLDFKRDKFSWELRGGIRSEIPDMVNMIEYTDDSDPLNIISGNPNLANITRYDGSFRLSGKGRSQRLWSVTLDYHQRDNDVAFGIVADKASGGIRMRPVNVNGNWSTAAGFDFSQALGKSRRWNIDNRLSVGYNHNVDMATTSDFEESMRSIVNNWKVSDNVRLNFRPDDKNEMSLHLGGSYYIIDGKRSGFDDIKAGDYQIGMNAIIRLPWKLTLSSDMTMYARRGYQMSEMNSTDWIWNAEIIRGFAKDRLLVKLQGVDILHQLSNTLYTVNAQGRTETWYNSLPKYIMASVTWKINKNPKMKKK